MKLKTAIDAEDAFLADLGSRGYGGQEPNITAPYWLQRDDVAA